MNFFYDLKKTLIIAEIGVNHNGDMGLAKELILAAKKTGADAVKFQTFRAETLVMHATPKVPYQIDSSLSNETHYEMLKRLELSEQAHLELADYCNTLKIDFISTPYDIDSAAFLLSLGVPYFKTASADIVDIPLQKYIASTGKPCVIATGMANLGEVERIVDIYNSAQNPNIVLLHAVSNYPCTDDSINLRSMATMTNCFSVPVGLSDHSVGHVAAVMAIAMGAKVIEKHFTLDKSMQGPDHKASSTPVEFSALVQSVRRAESILGSSQKKRQLEELDMAVVSRKSLTIVRDIMAGEVLSDSDIRLMRPGTGIEPFFIDRFIGKVTRINLKAGSQLKWSDIESSI